MPVGGSQATWGQHNPWGIQWEWIDDDTAKVVPTEDDRAGPLGYVPLRNDNRVSWQTVTFDSDITMDMDTDGPNGVHPDYTGTGKNADTGYDICFIGGPAGLDLLAIESGDTIVNGTAGANEVSIDDVTATTGDYTHWSTLSWFFAVDGGADIVDFLNPGGRVCVYRKATSELRVVWGGKATSATAIPVGWTGPEGNIAQLLAFAYYYNNDSTSRDSYYYGPSSASALCQGAIGCSNAAGYARYQTSYDWYPFCGAPNASGLYYKWMTTPTSGLTFYVMGWELMP